MNRSQAKSAEELQAFNFDVYYWKGSSNQKADLLSRCLAFTSKEGGTTAAGQQMLLRMEQWLEVGAMKIEDGNVIVIRIGAIEVDQWLPEAMEWIQEKALLDEDYMAICRQLSSGGNIDKGYEIRNDLLCWKNRGHAPNGLGKRIMESEHDSKVARHFGRQRTMELLMRNLYRPNMETNIRMYCNECNNCQCTKAPCHSKHGLLHPFEMACKPWTNISTDFITDQPESEGATMILVVVDHFMKMAHCIPIKKHDSPTVARSYLENIWKYHGFPDDVVLDRDRTFTGKFCTDLYDYLGIKRSMSTAYDPQSDWQTERINQVVESYLRSYCNYKQNDWASMLAMAEYAYNNSKYSATKMSLCYANYRFEPRTNWPTEVQFNNPALNHYGYYITSVNSKLLQLLKQ